MLGLLLTNRDFWAGVLLIVIGAGAAIIAQDYDIGTLRRMGPGFFPMILGIALAFIGTLQLLTSGFSNGSAPVADDHGHGGVTNKPEWRGKVCIVLGILAFILLGEYAGMIPATLGCIFISAMGDNKATWIGSALLAIGLTIFGVLLFHYVLQVQFPLLIGVL